jgi:hypothetical protein
MRIKLYLSILLTIVVATSLIMVEHVGASVSQLNLPSSPVTIEVYNGTGSYFYTLVSGISAGYDVANRTYRAWCVDIRTVMKRSPAIHNVVLFSTYTPPMVMPDEKWDMVNYVLNHKQGNAEDIQQAIWHFISLGDNYTASSANALAMINDADVNGTGFIPGSGEVVAVICYPVDVDVQISIIEVPPQTLFTDLNCDGVVNMVDITMIAAAFGSKVGNQKWSNIADVNHNGVINIVDITLLTIDFGKRSP